MMVYDSAKEMAEVLGRLDENSFIKEQEEDLKCFSEKVKHLLEIF